MEAEAEGGVAQVDSAAIASAVIAAVQKQGVQVDAGSVAAAVEAALADEFAAIPVLTAAAIGKKLA